jgi:hypothetical protein
MPKFIALHLQMRFVKPRRANARRSCERAFAHRECRFLQRSSVRTAAAIFSGEPALCNEERMACASRGERIESADGIRMCAGRVPERSDVPVEFPSWNTYSSRSARIPDQERGA